MKWLRRILTALRIESHQRELDEELQFHLAMRAKKNRDEGMDTAEARRNARLRFGNPVLWRERMSEVDGTLFLRSIVDDLRFGLRQLGRSPAFTLTAVLTLALGIGANTTIFSVADAVLLQPLPYPGASRMIAIRERLPKTDINDSWPDYLDWRAQNDVFDEMAALQPSGFGFVADGSVQSVPGASVTDSFFPLFGVNPMMGRAFTSAESIPGAAPTAVVSYGFWQRYLGGDRNAVGNAIQLDGASTTVVGVLPRDFSVPWGTYEVYLPLGLQANAPMLTNRANHPGLQVVARLRSGVTLAAARSQMASIMQRLGRAWPESDRDETAVLVPLMDQFVSNARSTLLLLLGATGLVLLLACANVANMSLARSTARQREFAIRASLGAARARLFRQALTENLPLAILGGAGGLGLAALITGPLVHLYPEHVFRLEQSHLNGSVLWFALATCLSCWLLSGIMPAIAVCRRGNTYVAIRTATPGSRTAGQARLRSVLLTAEIAIALVVTICTGLLLRSLADVLHVDPGFRADHLLALEGVHAEHPGADPQNLEFYRELLARLRHLPGVQDAGAAMELPLHGAMWTSPYVPSGHAQALNTQEPWTEINVVTPGYFQTMQIRLLRGRFLGDADDIGSAPVAVINEAMARSLAPGDPTGRQIYAEYSPHTTMQVVGVVADVKQFGLDRQDMPEVYVPAAQAPMPAMDIALRTSADPDALARAAAMAVHAFDENQPAPRAVAMEAFLDAGLGDRRFLSLLLGLFDALGVLLAVIGVMGVVSYTVEQRTQEIGVRIALGARKSDVMRMFVFAQAGRLAVVGVALGIAAAWLITRLLTSELFGVAPNDPLTFVLASLLLVLATLFAGYLPARRATRVNPVVALRCD